MERAFTPLFISVFWIGISFSQTQADVLKPTLELKNSIEIKELNDEGEADCYPFITENGLSLYYTISGDKDKIVYATRKSIDAPFSKPKTVKLDGNDTDILSCWLTADELNIFYTVRKSNFGANTTLMRGTRSSVADDFSAFTTIKLKGKLSGNLFGPSFTPDLEELYFYNSNDKQQILRFTKNSEDTYELDEVLPMNDDYDVSPGQLSKDGLRFYFSVKTGEDFSQMAYYQRASLKEDFSEITWMKKDPNLFYIGQFSEALNGKYIFYKISESNSWEQNQLYFSEMHVTEQEAITGPEPVVEEMSEVEEELWDFEDSFFEDSFFEENAIAEEAIETETEEPLSIELSESLEVFPNPTTTTLHIKGFQEDEEVLIVDIQGKVVFEGLSTSHQVDVSSFTAGRYFIHFTERPEQTAILFEKN